MQLYSATLFLLIAALVAVLSWLDRGVTLRPRAGSAPRRHRSP